LLYWSEHSPGPALVVCHDWKSSRSFASDRVRPAFRDARLYDSHGDVDEGVELHQPGEKRDNSAFRMSLGPHRMPCTFVPASTATGLAMRPIRFLICDEISRFPTEAKGRTFEGDAIALARIRTTTYGDSAKAIYVSSPVEQHLCRVTELFENSSRERFYSRCPLCGNLQVLTLHEMDFESATCRCLKCGQAHGQDQWQAGEGKWIPENSESSRRGFWVNAFASPFVRWPTIFAEFKLATHRRREGDESLFKVVQSTRLAECYTEHVTKMAESEVLMSRRENYPAEVPNEARVIVCAIDTQSRWLQYLVAAGGPHGEIWLLRTGAVEGRLESDASEMYAELDSHLFQRRWKRPDGREMSISRCLQDSGGHATSIVYQFCRKFARVMLPFRGSPDLRTPWKFGADTVVRSRLVQANVSHFKDVLNAKLQIETPGAGYLHFGPEENGFDQEFFEQLLSERKETRKRLGVTTTRWAQLRERNESLDLAVMILVALETYRGTLDTMEPRIVTTDKERAHSQDQQGSPFGARRMVGAKDLIPDELPVGGMTGFKVAESPRPTRFGVVPGSGVSF
jgi:phage terminase large subunit GpA-like protein